MKIDAINIYLLSKEKSAPPRLRKDLSLFGIDAFGLYHSYEQLLEMLKASGESCLIIDLLENEGFRVDFDLEYFVSQALPHSMVQGLCWTKDINQQALVEIDNNFQMIAEDVWPEDEAADGLVRMPLYYFSADKALSVISEKGIDKKGEEWVGLPVACSERSLNYGQKVPALFLDRDGIMNEDQGYVYQYEKLVYKEEVFSLIKLFNDRKWPVFVVTNQSGIAMLKYDEDDVLKLHQEMEKDLAEKGLKIEEWVYSPFHEDKGIGKYKRYSFTRKPGAGMALSLLQKYPIDIERSFMIGDKKSDQLLLPGLTTLLLKGKYDLEGAKSPSFSSLTEIQNYIEEEL